MRGDHKWPVKILGMGYALGSRVESNADVGKKLGLGETWFEERTGIKTRRIPGERESVMSMSADAIRMACREAALGIDTLDTETVLIHIQNGFTHLTPPPGILLGKTLGARKMRTVTLDGVCAEPINAIEIACLMLQDQRCQRVIISAGVDFLPVVCPTDPDTVGLFGAGAGALVLAPGHRDEPEGIYSLYWETDTKYWDLGVIPALNYRQMVDRVEITFGYYEMRGSELARVALSTVPMVVEKLLSDAKWSLKDIDRIVTHQPNARFLEMGIRRANIPAAIVECPVVTQGNLGPASLLTALAQAKEAGRICSGSKVLLLSFGLGFSCGGATIVL